MSADNSTDLENETIEQLERAVFRKSSYSSDGYGGCVEVAEVTGIYGVRDSKNRHGSMLVFNSHEWNCFIRGVKAGEFG